MQYICNLEVMTEDLGNMKWNDSKKACADLGDGWRLPTKDELNLLYKNKEKIGGFAMELYWSSTEIDSVSAWNQNFWNGGHSSYYKGTTHIVRAVRTF